MTSKIKNEDSTQQSLLARVRDFIGHGKTRQIEIDASPSECLNWIGSLKGSPPEMIGVAVETQAVKRPYQFTVHITQPRHQLRKFGVVIGDVTQTPLSESKSLVTLRFYHNIGRILTIIMFEGYFVAIAAACFILPLRYPHSRYPIEWFVCLAIAGSGIIGFVVWGMKKFLATWRESLDMVSIHLLKLNTDPITAD